MLRGATGQGGALQRRGGERRTRGPMEGRSRPARRSMRVDPRRGAGSCGRGGASVAPSPGAGGGPGFRLPPLPSCCVTVPRPPPSFRYFIFFSRFRLVPDAPGRGERFLRKTRRSLPGGGCGVGASGLQARPGMRGLARAGPGAGEVTGGPRSGVICIALPPARVGIGRAAAEGGAGPGSASPAGARSRQPAAAIVTVAGALAPPGKEVGAARPRGRRPVPSFLPSSSSSPSPPRAPPPPSPPGPGTQGCFFSGGSERGRQMASRVAFSSFPPFPSRPT